VPWGWSLVGLAAALQPGVTEDLVLPVAGLVLVVVLVLETLRPGRPRAPASEWDGGAELDRLDLALAATAP